jgi:hypothetical protein
MGTAIANIELRQTLAPSRSQARVDASGLPRSHRACPEPANNRPALERVEDREVAARTPIPSVISRETTIGSRTEHRLRKVLSRGQLCLRQVAPIVARPRRPMPKRRTSQPGSRRKPAPLRCSRSHLIRKPKLPNPASAFPQKQLPWTHSRRARSRSPERARRVPAGAALLCSRTGKPKAEAPNHTGRSRQSADALLVPNRKDAGPKPRTHAGSFPREQRSLVREPLAPPQPKPRRHGPSVPARARANDARGHRCCR